MVDAGEGPPQPRQIVAPVRWWRAFRRWPAFLRFPVYAAAVLSLVLVVGLVAGVVVVHRSWPQTSGELDIPGLDSDVEVVRDAHGIPQIYASTTHDLMLAEGYVHAQERFFEMDVRRHATAGRLSELFGKDALPTDLVTRTLGWRRVAARELTLLQPSTRALLDAYADGVNAYLDGRSLSQISLEYSVLDLSGLDYHPEKWTAVDSLAWLKAMAWDLRGNLDEEIGRALSAAAVGKQRADQLYPPYDFSAHPPIVTQGAVVDDVFDQDATPGTSRLPERPAPDITAALRSAGGAIDAVPPLLGQGDGIGSNSWVVSGDRTESGSPILANDPHLGVSLPGVWMQVGLHCKEVTADCPFDVAGFSFSGVPGVVIGHNQDIAWGFTNEAPDVTDLYVERVRGDRWQYDGRMRKLRERSETIKVRDGDDVHLTVRSTAHGPLLSDIADEADGADVDLGDQVADAAGSVGDDGKWDHEVALEWTALTPRPTADALFALDAATDWTSFRAALSKFDVPGQNVVYADRDGNIGYQATGRVPIRRSGNDGLTPTAGWKPEDDWTGSYVPFDALPSVRNPDDGMIVTANQPVVDPAGGYPYFLSDDNDYGYRSTRIAQLLSDDDSLTVDDMSRIQGDDYNAMAAVLTPYLLKVHPGSGYYGAGQRLLEHWDFHEPADSAAAAYYNVVWSELLHRTFADELPKSVEPDGGDRWFAVVTDLLKRPDDPWWDDVDTDQVENRDDILTAALRAARDDLTARQSPDPDAWSWGKLHRLELKSSTLGESGIGPIEWLFNRGPWDVGSGGSLVDATSWDARDGYGVTSAPSMRMIVPMDDLDAARWISLTGVSGHAFNPHYTDQTDLWAKNETLPWAFSADAVHDAGVDTLTLHPAD